MVVIDRGSVSTTADELEQLVALDSSRERNTRAPLIVEARVLLAALSIAAGAIHLAMVPSHAGEWRAEGIAFAVAGFVQIILGGLFFSRRWQTALRVSCIVNAVFIGAWAVTRIWGSPWGPNSGVSESAGFVDVTCVVLEAALVVAGITLLAWRPHGYRLRNDTRALYSIVPIGIIAIATIAVTSPSAASHAHGHVDAASAAGAGGGHTHGGGGAAAGGDGSALPGHTHGVASLNGAPVKGVKAADVAAESQPDKPLDRAARAQLKAQLIQAREVALAHPTVAQATADGYILAGGFAPGSGAHYILGSYLTGAGAFDPSRPLSLIYAGTSPSSEITGLMYYGISPSAPTGFAGPNDHWHRHSNVCIKYGSAGIQTPFPADADVTQAQCDAAGGNLMKVSGWMVHAWVVPSWESPLGVFSHDNPNVRCADGTYKTDKAGFCQGI